MSRFWFLYFLLLTSLLGCVTTPKMNSEAREEVLRKFGSHCRDMDGSHVLSLNQNAKFFSMDMDWVSKADGAFLGQIIDPLGRSVAEWSIDGQHVVYSSKIESPLQKLGVNPSGFLTFDGQGLYLRAEELSCLLKGFVPREWLMDIEGEVSIWGSSYTDHERKVVVSRVSNEVCGTVGPGGIIGWLAKPIKFCISPIEGEILWGERFRLEWRSLDEPGS